jgi:hypothetical protein
MCGGFLSFWHNVAKFSLALAPLDYHVFGSQKEALHVDEDLPVLMKFRV